MYKFRNGTLSMTIHTHTHIRTLKIKMYNISHVEFTINGIKWSYAICDVLAKSESFMTFANAYIYFALFFLFPSIGHKVHFVSWNKCLNVHKSSKNKESYLKTHIPLTQCRDYHMPTNRRQTVILKTHQCVWHAIAHLRMGGFLFSWI